MQGRAGEAAEAAGPGPKAADQHRGLQPGPEETGEDPWAPSQPRGGGRVTGEKGVCTGGASSAICSTCSLLLLLLLLMCVYRLFDSTSPLFYLYILFMFLSYYVYIGFMILLLLYLISILFLYTIYASVFSFYIST